MQNAAQLQRTGWAVKRAGADELIVADAIFARQHRSVFPVDNHRVEAKIMTPAFRVVVRADCSHGTISVLQYAALHNNIAIQHILEQSARGCRAEHARIHQTKLAAALSMVRNRNPLHLGRQRQTFSMRQNEDRACNLKSAGQAVRDDGYIL